MPRTPPPRNRRGRVVEHAYRGGRQHALDVHERGAVDAQGAQVGGRFVEYQLKAFAVERRIAFPGQHKPALALAVRDEQLDLGEPFAPLRQALRVVAAGEVGEQIVDASGLRSKRLLDLVDERAFLLRAVQHAVDGMTMLQQVVVRPQAVLLPLERLAPLVDGGDVLGQERRPAGDIVAPEQRMRDRRGAEARDASPGKAGLQEHGMRRVVVGARLEQRGVQRHLAGARKDAQVERQRGEHGLAPVVRRKYSQVKRYLKAGGQ